MNSFINLDFDIKEIVLATKVPVDKGSAVHHDRPSHGLAIHLAGNKYYYFSDGRTLNVKGGEIIFLPKGADYIVTAEQPGVCYAINFNLFEDKKLEAFVFHPKNISKLTSDFKSAYRLWRDKLPGYVTGCKGELYSIIHTVQSEHSMGYVSADKLNIIAPAVKHIHENYTLGPISIADISKMCNITPEYFRCIFRQKFGTSPVKYINELKISRAKELIQSGMYSVNEAAALSGYTDPAHFSREFKKSVGISPSKYHENL